LSARQDQSRSRRPAARPKPPKTRRRPGRPIAAASGSAEGRFHIAHCPLWHHARAQRRPDGQPANQGGIEAPACSLIVRRRFAHHRSIAFSAARIASRLAPSIEPSRGFGGV
jgi:hypothetical protein